MGEYYTPDWLAERCLNQVGYGPKERGLLEKRVLDPGCGSGTFLVLAIKRAREHARLNGIDQAKTLVALTLNIVGFDINPMAVIAARTNYLLAIADLLRYKRGEVTIPVYLCDSINPPRTKEQAELFDQEGGYYTVPTSIAQFRFPDTLVKRNLIQKTAAMLEDSVKKGQTEAKFLERLHAELKTPESDVKRISRFVGETYGRLVELERRGINGIWARIIRNAFAPLFVGQFDFVVGNPPWVNWESLPPQYREATGPIWQQYDLFEHTGLRARLGSAKDDISVLMTYVSIDNYLKDNGRLCMVITQSVFKTVGGGKGFRRFRLGSGGTPFRVYQVDDMVELQPFDSATNRTAVFLCQKGMETEYPVEYHLWRKKEKGSIAIDLSWSEVQAKTVVSYLKAQSIDGTTQGPWISAKPRALQAVRQIVGKAAYGAREGANNGGLAGAYWALLTGQEKDSIVNISNLFDSGKIKVQGTEARIETSVVYPLLRWSDMAKWTYEANGIILIPHRINEFSKPISLNQCPELALKYFSRFESQLRSRALYQKYLLPQGYPFYAIYNVGQYTLSRFKVCWQTMGEKLRAVVVSETDMDGRLLKPKAVVPQHTIVFVPLDDYSEAHYVCALMNSSISDFLARSYSMGKSFGNPHILDYIRIPKYNQEELSHRDLALLSTQCHEKASLGIDVSDLEGQVDELAAELWGLTKDDLKEIKESLEAMQ